MAKETLLKKEFKKKDVTRIRNLIKKDYISNTKTQTGYSKPYVDRKEGEVWEEDGKRWKVTNGIKVHQPKTSKIRSRILTPLKCPKCGGPMQHPLAKKMYKIHGFCFDPCTVEYEKNLREAGLYSSYEKNLMKGNIKRFLKDIEEWYQDQINSNIEYVTEDGAIEDWKVDKKKKCEQMKKNIQTYTDQVKKHLD